MANVVSIVFTVNGAQGQQTLTQIQAQITGLGQTAQQSGSQVDGALAFFKSALIIEFFRRGASEALAFGKAAVAAFNEARNAALGLETVAKGAGVDPQAALAAVQNLDLVKNGLLTVAEASTALKNNLRTGFSLEQSIDLIKKFGDAAAFNKQSAISFGDAVVRTSEGIRQNLSTLADAGGITTNLSVILGRAGLTFDDLTDKVNGQANATKFYNELLKETAVFSGDADKKSKEFAGQIDALNSKEKILMQTIGEIITSSPELQKGFQAVGDTLEYLTSQLKDSDSELHKFVANSAAEFGVLIEITAKLVRGINAIAAVINFLNPIGDALNPDVGVTKDELQLQKDAKIANDKIIQAYKDAQKKLNAQLADAPILDAKQLKLIREASDALTDLKSKLSDDPFKSLDEASARREREFLQRFKDAPDQVKDSFRIENAKLLDVEISKLKAKQDKDAQDTAEKQKKLFAEVGNATLDLQAKLSINPVALMFDAAARRQADFLEKFKEVPKVMTDAFIKASQEAAQLDFFKSVFGQGQGLGNLLNERAKLEAGGDADKLARLQRENVDAQLRLEKDFLSRSQNAAQRGFALEQILATTSGGNLTAEQRDVRFAALDESIVVAQKAFVENFARLENQTNAQKDNTVALTQLGTSLKQADEGIQRLATRESFIRIEIDPSLDARTAFLPSNL
jgi:hypothetical protein